MNNSSPDSEWKHLVSISTIAALPEKKKPTQEIEKHQNHSHNTSLSTSSLSLLRIQTQRLKEIEENLKSLESQLF